MLQDKRASPRRALLYGKTMCAGGSQPVKPDRTIRPVPSSPVTSGAGDGMDDPRETNGTASAGSTVRPRKRMLECRAVNTRSGLPTRFGTWIRYLYPKECNKRRAINSGFVFLLRIRLITCLRSPDDNVSICITSYLIFHDVQVFAVYRVQIM